MSSLLINALRSMFFACTFLALAACGGGGGGSDSGSSPAPTPTAQQGYFIDSAVEGLNYSASPSGLVGVTDSAGEYNYQPGDTITFSIGNIVLGSAPAAGHITPLDLVDGAGADTSNQQVVNISRLLMTLDVDGNPDNGIEIPDGIAAAALMLEGESAELDFTDVDFAIAAQAMIDGLTTDLIGEGLPYTEAPNLATSVAAQTHLSGSLVNTDGDDEVDLVDNDDDNDEIADASDNCPLIANANQLDTDSDEIGDACDTDDDGDEVDDDVDNCPLIANADQRDTDGDDSGDVCDGDDDGDEIADESDNCSLIVNADQLDTDSDDAGNVCDTDDDNDGVIDTSDNCQLIANADQLDTDGDLSGNACDSDDDGDEVADASDNCPLNANADQLDTDGDQLGNECDSDDDGDGVADDADAFPLDVTETIDTDGDGTGNNADTDDDNDQIPDSEDDNPLVADSVTVTISGEVVNGTINPSQTQIVNEGTRLEFTVTADDGYYPQISGCGGTLAGATFTTAAVNEDCVVELSFDELSQVISPLNDTGITRCANAESNDLDCVQEGFPGQDAEYGRDVTHHDNSDGLAGFSFTKICNSGYAAGDGGCPAEPVLGSGANDWACTLDNITGLMWEIKTDDGGVRDKNNTYTWYNSDSGTNGGNAGTENGGSCPDAGNCDTEKYVVSVNAAGLCGFSDWRMPLISELKSIVDRGRYDPAIDTSYFPNTMSNTYYYTASPYSNFSSATWGVYFDHGYCNGPYSKGTPKYVRLVRQGNN